MTTIIDGDRLRAWLESQQRTLINSARERHEADGPNDPTALRMDGGVANMHVLLTQLDNFRISPEARARTKDPGTSHVAARKITPESMQVLQQAILRVLGRKPMTDDELIAVISRASSLSVTPSGVRTRRSELGNAGYLRDSGQKRQSAAGGLSIVWEVVPDET